MNYLVTTNELSKKYKDTEALKDVSIHIPKGSIYGLVGNNGAGKTTLMRLVLGLQKPTSGTIHMNKSVKTGAILESPSYYPYWSAKRNLNYQLSLIDSPKYTADELLKIVGLKDTIKPILKYSLGMRQRLGIALALANHPDLLFLDEPLNGLDPIGIREIRNLIQKLCYEDGITIIISSHILDELQKVATHIGFLRNGILIKECTLNEINCDSLEDFYFNEYN
ncbi:MAG: ATP-binding cassette domain-containing protein [Agathobacter sp.]|nr:ATP-binding cassette domain-containing protein [Agathobacter sp.]